MYFYMFLFIFSILLRYIIDNSDKRIDMEKFKNTVKNFQVQAHKSANKDRFNDHLELYSVSIFYC